MLNGVSNVSFSAGVFDKPKVDAPQTFTRPNAPDSVDVSTKKKGKGKKVAAFLLTNAAIIAGLVIGANTGAFKNVGKIIPNCIKNAGWLQWAKTPTKAVMGALDVAGNWLANVLKMVAGLFSKKPAAAPGVPGVGTV